MTSNSRKISSQLNHSGISQLSTMPTGVMGIYHPLEGLRTPSTSMPITPSHKVNILTYHL